MSIKELDPEIYTDLIQRMRRIEGQVRGIQRLMEAGADCEAITVQVAAVKSAISRAGMKLVTCQLGRMMQDEIKEGGSGKSATAEMMEAFLRL